MNQLGTRSFASIHELEDFKRFAGHLVGSTIAEGMRRTADALRLSMKAGRRGER